MSDFWSGSTDTSQQPTTEQASTSTPGFSITPNNTFGSGAATSSLGNITPQSDSTTIPTITLPTPTIPTPTTSTPANQTVVSTTTQQNASSTSSNIANPSNYIQLPPQVNSAASVPQGTPATPITPPPISFQPLVYSPTTTSNGPSTGTSVSIPANTPVTPALGATTTPSMTVTNRDVTNMVTVPTQPALGNIGSDPLTAYMANMPTLIIDNPLKSITPSMTSTTVPTITPSVSLPSLSNNLGPFTASDLPLTLTKQLINTTPAQTETIAPNIAQQAANASMDLSMAVRGDQVSGQTPSSITYGVRPEHSAPPLIVDSPLPGAVAPQALIPSSSGSQLANLAAEIASTPVKAQAAPQIYANTLPSQMMNGLLQSSSSASGVTSSTQQASNALNSWSTQQQSLLSNPLSLSTQSPTSDSAYGDSIYTDMFYNTLGWQLSAFWSGGTVQ